MIYYAVKSLGSNELLAVGKAPMSFALNDFGIITQVMKHRINDSIETEHWWWDTTISQAEYETYQAFGIKEI